MKNNKNIIWGFILVVFGILFLLNVMGVMELKLFEGWWTFFIIIPSFIDLVFDDHKTSSLIWLLVGIGLYVTVTDLITFDLLWKLLLPTVIIVIGCSLIFKEIFNKELNEKVSEYNKTKNKENEIWATFSEQKVNKAKEKFTGCDTNSIFGSVKLDLTEAKIEDGAVINTTNVFGDTKIMLPEDIIVKTKSTSIFGDVDNKYKKDTNEKSKTVYINATCIFGGVDIR